MDRTIIEPAITILITEIHTNSGKLRGSPRLPTLARWQAASPKASPSRWISNRFSMRPEGCRMPPRS
jgi:hypothetical protein